MITVLLVNRFREKFERIPIPIDKATRASIEQSRDPKAIEEKGRSLKLRGSIVFS